MKDSSPIGLLKGSSRPMSLFQLLEDGCYTAQRRISDYEELHMYRTKKRKKATYFKTYVATGILETMPIRPIINISHHQVYIAGKQIHKTQLRDRETPGPFTPSTDK
ncbi:hypothetical protein VTJ04DRAFT_8477 [Mycothermus thermophilus]|uniref:uncharacterized protein n=1 Tax=Humicola insolens TaxID=85995 RepID=UPI003742939A